MNTLARAAAIAVLVWVAGCGPDVAAGRRTASRLLDECKYDSARVLVKALARRCPNDTGVLRLQVQLYSAERRLRGATDALRRYDSLLGTHDSALAVTVLMSALKDEDEQVVVCAIGACGELALAPLFTSVRSALDDRSPYIRCAAVYALPRYNRDSTASELAPMMLDDHPAVRAEMLKSAARLRDKSMLQLTRAMGYLETNDYVIWNYIVMCAVLGESGMADRVRRELNGEHDLLRTEAAAALVSLGEKQKLPTVAAGLRSSDESVREAAANALGDLHATEYLDSLANCARDSDVGVREAVAYGLGEMGDARGAGAARTLLTDHKETVRARALIALGRLRQPDIDKIATAALADSSLAVRATAVAVLLASRPQFP
ncbi:MAG: HEAT repeat domain-containing protein [candidate division WOR-3 bacterium]|nr:HEAT repeat domain-containing protein [candidate division WOR-3 bacterium]